MLSFKLAVNAIAILQWAALAACFKLLRGGTIIAFDQSAETLQVIRNGSILIEEDRVTSVYDVAAPANIPDGTEVIDCTNTIITPGFIDTHRHGWQTVFKTMGSNTTLAEYFLRYSAYVAAPLFTPDDLYISQLTGIYEALAAGVTTIVDHAHHTWTPEHAAAGLNASVDSGARIYFAYTFQNSSAEFGVPEQISQWRELAASISSNLTKLSVAYDDFTGNPTGADTIAILNLIRYVLNQECKFRNATYKCHFRTSNASLLTTHHVEGPWMRKRVFDNFFPHMLNQGISWKLSRRS
jgi:cytosine/adenosine deaminase-related metal-dependent hydrolase